MARNKGRRGTSETANDPLSDLLLQPIASFPLVTTPLPEPLTLLEDRRLFHPESFDAPAAAISDAADTVLRPSKARPGRPQFSPRIGFKAPDHVATCVRRQIRREVILAKGRGGGRHRRPRRNWRSEIEC